MKRRTLLVILAALTGLGGACGHKKTPAGGTKLRLATTTSVMDSGLLPEILPAFEKRTGYKVEIAAVGSGKALDRLASGEADVAITHAPPDEQAALADGRVARRTPVMHNDFVLVGPREALPVVAGLGDVGHVMAAIAASDRTFVSRGDHSGTHQREQALWKAAGVTPAHVIMTNAGMGATLDRAAKDGAFTLCDRGTWLAKKPSGLVIVFEGDAALRNIYSVIEPVAGKGNGAGARALLDYLRSPEGRAAIGGFGVAKLGEPLFTPEP